MQNSLIFMVSESKCYFPRERRHPCGVWELLSSNINTALASTAPPAVGSALPQTLRDPRTHHEQTSS